MTSMPNSGSPFGGISSQAHRRNIGMLIATQALFAQVRQPAETLERELDLPDARRDRDAQRGVRVSADDPVLCQSVATLKPFDAIHERAAVYGRSCRRHRARRQIAQRHESPLECVDPRVRLAWMDDARKRRERHRGESTLSSDRSILRQHRAQGAILRELRPQLGHGFRQSDARPPPTARAPRSRADRPAQSNAGRSFAGRRAPRAGDGDSAACSRSGRRRTRRGLR